MQEHVLYLDEKINVGEVIKLIEEAESFSNYIPKYRVPRFTTIKNKPCLVGEIVQFVSLYNHPIFGTRRNNPLREKVGEFIREEYNIMSTCWSISN